MSFNFSYFSIQRTSTWPQLGKCLGLSPHHISQWGSSTRLLRVLCGPIFKWPLTTSQGHLGVDAQWLCTWEKCLEPSVLQNIRNQHQNPFPRGWTCQWAVCSLPPTCTVSPGLAWWFMPITLASHSPGCVTPWSDPKRLRRTKHVPVEPWFTRPHPDKGVLTSTHHSSTR